MNMNHNAKDQVLSLLQSYRATKRKIEQLRYELEHPARVTPDEMIEAMNFAKGDGEGRPSGSVSNKTLYIAMSRRSTVWSTMWHFWNRGRPRLFGGSSLIVNLCRRSARKWGIAQKPFVLFGTMRLKNLLPCMSLPQE